MSTERAWISPGNIDRGEVTNCHVDGAPIRSGIIFIIHWKNDGRSPAVKVSVDRDFRVIPAGHPVEPFAREDAADIGSAMMGPGAQMTVSPIILNEQQTADFRARKVEVLLYSRVAYHDVFNVEDPNARRVSEMCVRAIHAGGIFIENDGPPREKIDFTPEGTQNTAT